jgi:Na+/melibiose symporter-like transporter
VVGLSAEVTAASSLSG